MYATIAKRRLVLVVEGRKRMDAPVFVAYI